MIETPRRSHTPPLAVSDLVTRVFLSRLTSRFKIKIRPPVQVDAVHLWRWTPVTGRPFFCFGAAVVLGGEIPDVPLAGWWWSD